jgi:uncharacterized protein DUF4177
MDYFEYKVIPAPRRGIRAKGAKGTAGKFAAALEDTINTLAADGWNYVRAESLPADERQGISMRKTETYQNVLIFRKLLETAEEETPVVAAVIEEDDADDEGLFDDINDDISEDEESAESDETESEEAESEESEKGEKT